MNHKRKWAYRTSDLNFLAIADASAEGLYEQRRKWLESQFIDRCKARRNNRAEIMARAEARRQWERKDEAIRKRRSPEGYADVGVLALAFAQGLLPPESEELIEEWQFFLRNELYCYADLLLDGGNKASQCVSGFAQHADDLFRDLMERRWVCWRTRLDYPEPETRDLAFTLKIASDETMIEFEKILWSESPAPATAHPPTPKGRPKAQEIDGEKVRALRGKASQRAFGQRRRCDISPEVLSKAEGGYATTETIIKICDYAAKLGRNLTPEDLQKKPQKTDR